MKYYISYFYNMRFFTPNILPLSTAVWDPKWFHNFKDSNYVFKNKNGIYSGIRAEMFNPGSCHASGCPCDKHKNRTEDCQFISQYREGLKKVDFNRFIETCERVAGSIERKDHQKIDSIVLLVYETPDNPCSERGPLIDLFKEHGIELKEWNK